MTQKKARVHGLFISLFLNSLNYFLMIIGYPSRIHALKIIRIIREKILL